MQTAKLNEFSFLKLFEMNEVVWFEMVDDNWEVKVPILFTLIVQPIMSTCCEASLQVINRQFWRIYKFVFQI